jgi:hypothetical protein
MEIKPSNQYNVTRISRLVDMYHDLHSSLAIKTTVEPADPVQERTTRLFSCPLCKKKMWRSIETFRMHKSNCSEGDPNGAPLPTCSDCGARFCSNLQYRAHLDSPDESMTHVCPLHCGVAFSSPSCLQYHVVHCFQQQEMGPYHVVRWKGREVADQILEVAADAGF